MIDASKVLYDYLAADTALTSIIGTRLWAEANTPPESARYKPSQGAGIVFKNSGGGMEASDTVLRSRWQFKVYGADVYAIRPAYLALIVDALYDTRGRGGINSSILEVQGILLAEPETEWLFMLTFFCDAHEVAFVYTGLESREGEYLWAYMQVQSPLHLFQMVEKGIATAGTYVTPDATNGNKFYANRTTLLHVKNANAATRTVTIHVTRLVEGQAVADDTFIVPALTGDVIYSGFTSIFAQDATGNVWIEFSAVTDVTVQVLQV